MIKKIISGGQTGVDQAALDTARKLKIPHIVMNKKPSMTRSEILLPYFGVQEKQLGYTLVILYGAHSMRSEKPDLQTFSNFIANGEAILP